MLQEKQTFETCDHQPCRPYMLRDVWTRCTKDKTNGCGGGSGKTISSRRQKKRSVEGCGLFVISRFINSVCMKYSTIVSFSIAYKELEYKQKINGTDRNQCP